MDSTDSSLALANPFACLVPANMPKPPRRMSEISMYMKIHYELRMKAEADRRLVIAQCEYEETTEDERIKMDLKPPVPLTIRLETAKQFWATKSNETKAVVRENIEREYTAAKEAWETKHQVPKTLQEYHQ